MSWGQLYQGDHKCAGLKQQELILSQSRARSLKPGCRQGWLLLGAEGETGPGPSPTPGTVSTLHVLGVWL